MPMGVETKVQTEFQKEFGGVLPERPARVKNPRNWNMFVDHVTRRIGFEALTAKYPDPGNGHLMSRERASQIVNQTFKWMLREKRHRTALQTNDVEIPALPGEEATWEN